MQPECKTEREFVISEIKYSQGFQDGVKMVTDMMIRRNLATLETLSVEPPKPA